MPFLLHLVEPVHAGRGFLGHAADGLRRSSGTSPACSFSARLMRGEEDLLFLVGRVADQSRFRLSRRCRPRWTNSVASPPSSRIMFGVPPSPHSKMRCVIVPVVLERLALDARTPACRRRRWRRRHGPGSRRCCTRPSARRRRAPCSVSISTAVWIVMCSEPAMRAPRSGCCGPVFLARRHQAGHLGLGDGDFLAAPIGEPDVLDDVVGGGGGGELGGFRQRSWRSLAAWMAGNAACRSARRFGAWL